MHLHSVGVMMSQSAVRFHTQYLNRQDAHQNTNISIQARAQAQASPSPAH